MRKPLLRHAGGKANRRVLKTESLGSADLTKSAVLQSADSVPILCKLFYNQLIQCLSYVSC